MSIISNWSMTCHAIKQATDQDFKWMPKDEIVKSWILSSLNQPNYMDIVMSFTYYLLAKIFELISTSHVNISSKVCMETHMLDQTADSVLIDWYINHVNVAVRTIKTLITCTL